MIQRVVIAIGAVCFAAACSSPLTTREKGALAGGAIGAGTGALIGSQVGHTGAGALIGAGVGAVSGAVIGDAIQGAEQKKAAAAPPAPAAPPVAVAAPPAVVAPPPVVVSGPPRLLWVPEWGVYVMEGHDIVHYNGAYYYFYDGRWWVSQSYAGPWAIITTVPPVIAKLPPGHLQAHVKGRGFCPPGQAAKGRC
jgi:hypothetical protein